jgi:hypothetical protein
VVLRAEHSLNRVLNWLTNVCEIKSWNKYFWAAPPFIIPQFLFLNKSRSSPVVTTNMYTGNNYKLKQILIWMRYGIHNDHRSLLKKSPKMGSFPFLYKLCNTY